MNEMVYIQTSLKAPKNQRNNFGNYNYRSCEDILEAVKPLLKETSCTLTVSDEIVSIADRIYVKATATLKTASGEAYTTTAFAREPLAKKGMDDSQVTGATSSYARKYALNGLFCIDDNKDADFLNTNKEFTEPPKAKAAEPKKKEPAKQAATSLFSQEQYEEAFQNVKPEIEKASSISTLMAIFNGNPGLHDYQPFSNAMTARKKQLLQQ